MSMIVGLTGGIGSGKTAASDYLNAEFNIPVIDADIIAREVVQPGMPALSEIRAFFGDSVILDDGQLNRAALREIVFNNAEQRARLEQITHPKIRDSIVEQLKLAKGPYVILVSPLLFESGQAQLCERTILIDVPEALQIQRVMHRDGSTEDQAKAIIASQMPSSEKRKLADEIVMNDDSLDHLKTQLMALHQKLVTLSENTDN